MAHKQVSRLAFLVRVLGASDSIYLTSVSRSFYISEIKLTTCFHDVHF